VERHSAYFDLAKARASVKNSARRVLCKRQRGFAAQRCFESTLALLGRTRMPVGVGKMSAAEPLGAPLAILLGATVAGFIQPRKFPDKKLFLFLVLRLVRSSHPPRDKNGTGKRHSARLVLPLRLVHAAAGNIHPPSAVATMWAHCASSRRDRPRGRIVLFPIELNERIRLHS